MGTFFYTDIHSSVKSNCHLTKYFPIKNSVRQGCPISALLYVLASEPFSCTIRSNKYIRRIPISMSNKNALSFQQADDTTLSVCDKKKSIFEIFHIFEMYEKSSGAKINGQKSGIMCIGTGRICEEDKKHTL